jgi:hypothetical protein
MCCCCSGRTSPGASTYPDKATIIQIDADPTHIGRRHPVAIGAVGDIKTTLEALLPRLSQHEHATFLATFVQRYEKELASAKAETTADRGAVGPGTGGEIRGSERRTAGIHTGWRAHGPVWERDCRAVSRRRLCRFFLIVIGWQVDSNRRTTCIAPQ